jgi:GNAT superfamily N-acetyltransferase
MPKPNQEPDVQFWNIEMTNSVDFALAAQLVVQSRVEDLQLAGAGEPILQAYKQNNAVVTRLIADKWREPVPGQRLDYGVFAVVGDVAVGFCGAQRGLSGDRISLYIEPEHRRKGIGSRALQAYTDNYADGRPASIYHHQDNAAAGQFLTRRGFTDALGIPQTDLQEVRLGGPGDPSFARVYYVKKTKQGS